MENYFHIRATKSLSRIGRRCILCYIAAAMTVCCSSAVPAHSQAPVSRPEEIEWTWEVRPPHPDPALPNVLLLGDSISRNYYPEVAKKLSGTANVYLMAVSTSVGDPRLIAQVKEFASLEKVKFSVVHFNNGMHGWDYTEAEYRAAFPEFLRAVGSLARPRGSLVWATITPVKANAFNGATNPRIDERNRVALKCVRQLHLEVDDQHALMTNHGDLYEDTVHYGPAGAAIMGDQAAGIIRLALKASGNLK